MMTSALVVETSVTITDNSPSKDYTHPDDQTTLLHVTPGFKPFTVLFTALHTCYVSYHVTWIGPFSKWPSIKRQKNLWKIWFCTIYRVFAHLGFFSLRGMHWDQKKGGRFGVSYPLI